MGFDPGRITDPVKREWTGKIEQQKTTRTLTWTKTIHSNATTTRISHSYRDGELVGIMYEFFLIKGETKSVTLFMMEKQVLWRRRDLQNKKNLFSLFRINQCKSKLTSWFFMRFPFPAVQSVAN